MLVPTFRHFPGLPAEVQGRIWHEHYHDLWQTYRRDETRDGAIPDEVLADIPADVQYPEQEIARRQARIDRFVRARRLHVPVFVRIKTWWCLIPVTPAVLSPDGHVLRDAIPTTSMIQYAFVLHSPRAVLPPRASIHATAANQQSRQAYDLFCNVMTAGQRVLRDGHGTVIPLEIPLDPPPVQIHPWRPRPWPVIRSSDTESSVVMDSMSYLILILYTFPFAWESVERTWPTIGPEIADRKISGFENVHFFAHLNPDIEFATNLRDGVHFWEVFRSRIATNFRAPVFRLQDEEDYFQINHFNIDDRYPFIDSNIGPFEDDINDQYQATILPTLGGGMFPDWPTGTQRWVTRLTGMAGTFLEVVLGRDSAPLADADFARQVQDHEARQKGRNTWAPDMFDEIDVKAQWAKNACKCM